MIAGVAAIMAALLSTTFATLLALSKLHFPARARITFIRSFAVLPACVVAPITAASAAIKYSSENFAITNGRVDAALGCPSPPALSVRYVLSFQVPGYVTLLIPLGDTT